MKFKYQIEYEAKESKMYVMCRLDLIIYRPGKNYSGKCSVSKSMGHFKWKTRADNMNEIEIIRKFLLSEQ